MSRTGPLVSALADGIRQDLEDIAKDMEALRAKVEELRESAIAINGLGGECAGWSNHLSSLVSEVKREMTEVPAKLTGSAINPIVTHVDGEHLEKVREKRRAS